MKNEQSNRKIITKQKNAMDSELARVNTQKRAEVLK